MDIRDRRALKEYTGRVLADAAYAPKKLSLIHTAASLAVTLVLVVISFILTRQIDGTGGLAGLGTRSILETAQTVLQFASTLLLPFWEIGFLYAAIRMARKEETGPRALVEGFRRFGPVLRLMLLRSLLAIGVLLLCSQVATTIYLLTPFSASYFQLYDTLMGNAATATDPTALLDEATMQAMAESILPVAIISAVLAIALLIPLLYRFRLAEYVIMDTPGTGAFAALRASNRMMRSNCVAMFRLDLSYWWFYLAQAVIALVGYGDVLLAALGVALPMSADTAYFLFYLLYIGGQLVLLWQVRSAVETTYAAAYDVLKEPQEPKPQPEPKNLPWTY